MKRNFIAFAILALSCGAIHAKTIGVNQFMIWGIGNDQIKIPLGSVITEAVLKINGVTSSKPGFCIYLLDDTAAGFCVGTDVSGFDYFDGYGAALKGAFVSGNYVCKLSQNEDPVSPIRSLFPSPCTITLANSASVSLSSSLLSIIDYAGNGRGFGIGLDPGSANFTFRSITLTLTLQTYQGAAGSAKLSFSITPR